MASSITSRAAARGVSGASIEPVGEHRHRQRLDVVGQGVVTAVHHRVRLGRPQQHQPGPRAGAEVDAGILARAPQQPDDVVAQRCGRPHAGGGILSRQHLGRGHHRAQRLT